MNSYTIILFAEALNLGTKRVVISPRLNSRRASQVALVVKNLPASVGRHKRWKFSPGVGKIPWKRARQSTPVVLLGESHGQRSLVGYSPWGHIELEHANLDIVIATQRQPYNLSYSAVYLAQISDLFDAIFKVNNF